MVVASDAQNVGINTATPQASLDVYGDVIFRSASLTVANGTTLALDVNSNRFSFYRLSGPTANFSIAGITQGVEGRLVTLFNRSGFVMQINHEDAAASANGRIVTGTNANLTIDNKGIVNLQYDGAEQRWIVLSNNKAGGGWGLNGNSSTNPVTDFIGTTDNQPFIIKSNNNTVAEFRYGFPSNNYIGTNFQRTGVGIIGTGAPTHTLEVGLADLNGGSQGGLGIRGTSFMTHFNYGVNEDVYIRGGKNGSHVIINDIPGIGNLAIGTNIPEANTKMTLQTPGDNANALSIRNPSGSVIFNAFVGGPGNGNTISLGTPGAMPMAFYTNSANRMLISANGDVGIGTATPEYKLHIRSPNENLVKIDGQNSLVLLHDRISNAQYGFLRAWTDAPFNPAGYYGLEIGTPPSSGTENPKHLMFSTNYALRMVILQNGAVGIGTTNPDPFYLLSVNGKIRAKEIRVNTGWADYVFDNNYHLKPLAEVEAFIKKHKHLPGIQDAATIQKEGVDIGSMQTKMMEKIEELTLYLIEANKKIEALEKVVKSK